MKQAAATIDHMNVRMLNSGCMAEVNLSPTGDQGDARRPQYGQALAGFAGPAIGRAAMY